MCFVVSYINIINIDNSNIKNFFIAWGFLILTSYLLLRTLFHHSPPLLNNIWKKWPESEYKLFLNVPHYVRLTWKDQLIDRSHIIHDNHLARYWRRDMNTTYFQQTTYYARNQKTLQEVLLHLALFDFLFHSKEKSQENKKSSHYSALKFKNWLYIFSPIWLNLLILFLSLTLMALIMGNDNNQASITVPLYNLCSFTCLDATSDHSISPLISFPFNFIWATLIWGGISLYHLSRWMFDLDRISNNVHSGYFNKHLELVPQQILGAITEIPDPEQIHEAITTLKQTTNIALVTLITLILVSLEVLANFYQH